LPVQHIATGRVLNVILFSDADLIGLPLRLTISERSLKAGGVEFKHRVGG
jgi:prolyl-tRNA synthetase